MLQGSIEGGRPDHHPTGTGNGDRDQRGQGTSGGETKYLYIGDIVTLFPSIAYSRLL